MILLSLLANGPEALPARGHGAEVVAALGREPAADLARRGYRPRPMRPVAGLVRRLNVAVSLASGAWVVPLHGDEPLADGWLEALAGELEAAGEAAVLVLRPAVGGPLGLMAIRREAFAAGAVDAGFPEPRLALLDWLYRIFAPPGHANRARVRERVCSWLGQPAWATAHPAPAVMSLWADLSAGDRARLLEQCCADGAGTLADLAALRQAMADAQARAGDDPYRQGGYDPKRFWEDNAAGYVKWEAYQQDEGEIEEIVARVHPASVLELGAGAGRNMRYFREAESYVGIDLSLNLLARAVDRQEDNCRGLLCGDVVRLPFADASFDMVFGISTLQHVTPDRVAECVAGIARVARRHIAIIEYTEESVPNGTWFQQVHMFAHDYAALFAPHARLVWRADTRHRIHAARKEVFLFEKAD